MSAMKQQHTPGLGGDGVKKWDGDRGCYIVAESDYDSLKNLYEKLASRSLNLEEALMGLVNQPLRYNANRIEIDCNDHGDAMARVRIASAALAKARGEQP